MFGDLVPVFSFFLSTINHPAIYTTKINCFIFYNNKRDKGKSGGIYRLRKVQKDRKDLKSLRFSTTTEIHEEENKNNQTDSRNDEQRGANKKRNQQKKQKHETRNKHMKNTLSEIYTIERSMSLLSQINGFKQQFRESC